jgi:hypothetical protein
LAALQKLNFSVTIWHGMSLTTWSCVVYNQWYDQMGVCNGCLTHSIVIAFLCLLQNDYGQYGLRIKVKFRNQDLLQDLTQNLQSGGERSVATAIYMISLQELTRVPFCCVDEINQVMRSSPHEHEKCLNIRYHSCRGSIIS